MAGYIHETALAKAIQRLYMLGNRPYTGMKGGSPGDAMVSAGTGFVSGLNSQPKVDAPVAQKAIEALAKQESNHQRTNSLALDSEMGGKYTPEGLQKAEKNAQLNAEDRLRMRALIGYGGY